MNREAAGREFRQRLDDVAQATEFMLDRLLVADPLPGETARPPRLVEAMRYAASLKRRGFSGSRARACCAPAPRLR
jgi:hypothetical protein